MDKGQLYIISAPSGTGKTSMVNELLHCLDDVEVSVSYTTRLPRESETDGQEYHFVDEATFQAMRNRNEFLEYAHVFGQSYGTSKLKVEERLSLGKDLILEIDWQGALQVRHHYPDALGIFILPPSLEALRRRITGRGEDAPEVIERRLQAASLEISHCGEYDYWIVNDRFDTAVMELMSIIRGNRCHKNRQKERLSTLLKDLMSTPSSL